MLETFVGNSKAIIDEAALYITDQKFCNTYIRTLSIVSYANKTLTILVKDSYGLDIIKNNYLTTLNQIIKQKIPGDYNINFICPNQPIVNPEPVIVNNEQKMNKVLTSSNLQSSWFFDNYIEGDFNRHAIKAAKLMATGTWNYNLLFISGGVGVGKSHLMNAIGLEYSKKYPDKKVIFLSTDDIYRKIYSQFNLNPMSLENLKDEFTSFDMLLVDDIQFMAKKEKISEIFFNIFNKMISERKIIVLTSDRTIDDLRQLPGIDARVISRLGSQMVININKPDIVSLKKIIHQKFAESSERFRLTDEAVEYLAARCSDIRMLCENINRINFFLITDYDPNSIISVNDIAKILSSNQGSNDKFFGLNINPMIIIEKICTEYNINVDIVISASRIKNFVNVRNICVYALRKKFNLTLNQIGVLFSNRSHATILEIIEKVEKKIKASPEYSAEIHRILNKL